MVLFQYDTILPSILLSVFPESCKEGVYYDAFQIKITYIKLGWQKNGDLMRMWNAELSAGGSSGEKRLVF